MEAKQTFKVIVTGGRDFGDYGLLCQTCDRMLSQKHQTHDIVIISGTARGADTLGERYAQERGYAVERFPADWEHAGKSAGFIRNAQMASIADALIAFWDGQSRGTAHMIDQARQKSLPYRVVCYSP